MTLEEIDEIITITHHEDYFRAEYEYDGYIHIRFMGNDEYEVKIEGVSYFDQSTASFSYCTKAQLIKFISQNDEKIGKWSV